MNFQIRQHAKKSQYTIFFFLVCTFFFNLSGCSFPSNLDSQVSNPNYSLQNGEAFPVNVTFNLHLPANLSPEENIVIEILDEVSGLPYNKDIYELTKIDSQLYSTELLFLNGSIIKYRYVKSGFDTTPEATWNGEPVRYRLLYAVTDIVINDQLQMWAGGMQTTNTGRITGLLLDAETKSPIPDILVSAAGQLTFSDANGNFSLENLSPNIHNLVFYALDGKYQTFQQEAKISPGLVTPVQVELTPGQIVKLTFQVQPPNDALGAPIYLAGNIQQLGNTFNDLMGSVSIRQEDMPQLVLNEDGKYSVSLDLYSGTYLRYKFTIGDGFWNGERDARGEIKLREMVVPKQDTSVEVTIDSWRSSTKAPITFQVQVQPERLTNQKYFIQFKNQKWTEPIPLWPIGDNNLLYILYTPLEDIEVLDYLVCNQENCFTDKSKDDTSLVKQIQPTKEPQTVTLDLNSSPSQSFLVTEDNVIDAYIPNRGDTFQTIIELSPSIQTIALEESLSNISRLAEFHTSTIIFTPQWFFNANSPVLTQKFNTTPLFKDLIEILDKTKSMGFSISLFPQIGPVDEISLFWETTTHIDSWWEAWFNSYSNFVLNYAKIAELSNAKQLIIGGKFLLSTFSGGIYPNGNFSDVPSNSDEKWQNLISEVRKTYQGELIWATNVHQARDPLPEFIYEFDGIYLLVDSPLVYSETEDFDTINWGFINVIDSLIYEVYRSTGLPITLGLGYPSVEGGALGCNLLENSCINDGIFSETEVINFAPDMQEQSLIYNAIFPVLSSREWITGVAVRGYNPTPQLDERSSSIAGKPALQVIEYWYSGLRDNNQ